MNMKYISAFVFLILIVPTGFSLTSEFFANSSEIKSNPVYAIREFPRDSKTGITPKNVSYITSYNNYTVETWIPIKEISIKPSQCRNIKQVTKGEIRYKSKPIDIVPKIVSSTLTTAKTADDIFTKLISVNQDIDKIEMIYTMCNPESTDLPLSNLKSEYLKQNETLTTNSSEIKQGKWTWWNYIWELRRNITITENSGYNLVNYQVNLTINTAPLISRGVMKSNCDDMRFANTSGTSLSYWIEDGTCNTNLTRVYVKIPRLNALEIKTIGMYYNNSAATQGSNIQETMISGDDFSKSIMNMTYWVNDSNIAAGTSFVNGSLTFIAANGWAEYLNTFPATNHGWESQIKIKIRDGAAYHAGFIHDDNGWDMSVAENHLISRGISYPRSLTVNGAATSTGANSVVNTWERYVFKINNTVSGSDNTSALAYDYTNNASWSLITTLFGAYPKAITGIALPKHSGNTHPNFIDWVFVRNYTSPIPSAVVGIEEIGFILPVYDTIIFINEPVNASTVTTTSPIFTFNVTSDSPIELTSCSFGIETVNPALAPTTNASIINYNSSYNIGATFLITQDNTWFYLNITCINGSDYWTNTSMFLLNLSIGLGSDINDWGNPTSSNCSGDNLYREYSLTVNGLSYERTETIACTNGCYAEKCRGSEEEENILLIFATIILPLLVISCTDLTMGIFSTWIK